MICLFLILRNSSSKKSNSRNAKRRRQANLVQLQQFKNGKLDMRTGLERFCMHFNEIYDKNKTSEIKEVTFRTEKGEKKIVEALV